MLGCIHGLLGCIHGGGLPSWDLLYCVAQVKARRGNVGDGELLLYSVRRVDSEAVVHIYASELQSLSSEHATDLAGHVSLSVVGAVGCRDHLFDTRDVATGVFAHADVVACVLDFEFLTDSVRRVAELVVHCYASEVHGGSVEHFSDLTGHVNELVPGAVGCREHLFDTTDVGPAADRGSWLVPFLHGGSAGKTISAVEKHER